MGLHERLTSVFRRADRIPTIVYMQDGSIVEEDARIVGTQVLLDKTNLAFRDRPGIPLYELGGNDQLPMWTRNIKFESGEAIRPGDDSLYVWADTRTFFRRFYEELSRPDGEKSRAMDFVVLGIALVISIGILVVGAIGAGSEAAPATAAETSGAPVPAADPLAEQVEAQQTAPDPLAEQTETQQEAPAATPTPEER